VKDEVERERRLDFRRLRAVQARGHRGEEHLERDARENLAGEA
jgi:hypothetical protein